MNMKLETWLVIMVVYIINSSISVQGACDCVKMNYKQAYCKGKFTAIINVVSGPQICFDVKTCYVTGVKETISNENANFIGIESFDTTKPGKLGECGRNFKEGSQYLVTGTPTDKGILKLTSCDYAVTWTGLEEAKRKKILDKFKDVKCDDAVDKFVDKAEDSAETATEAASRAKLLDLSKVTFPPGLLGLG